MYCRQVAYTLDNKDKKYSSTLQEVEPTCAKRAVSVGWTDEINTNCQTATKLKPDVKPFIAC
ncbi:MAG: hypothetical protein LBP67_04215 [Bacteroidales bacterium]|nr:hypothetical protein [Bacteroidales bacterium]